MDEAAAACNLKFRHYMQTNLIGWSSRWHDLVKTMFNGSLGTSMDYPNDHRRLKNGSTEKYTELWLKSSPRCAVANRRVCPEWGRSNRASSGSSVRSRNPEKSTTNKR